MTLLQSRLPIQSIYIHDDHDSKTKVISHLVDHLCETYSIGETTKVLKHVEKRESITSTYIGEFCAIPHAHIPSLDGTYIACTSLNKPIRWNDENDEVILVFLLIGPPKHATVHLRILSQLTRLLHNKNILHRLIDATTPQEFYSTLFSKEL